MRILIDIGHPSHVHYFKNFIKIMESKGHVFFVSARNRSIIPQLLNKYKIDFWSRGRGYNNVPGKFFYLFLADFRLYRKSLKFKPDIFISFASPYAAQVAWLYGKPHIVLDDTEHTRFAPFFYKPFSNTILTPSCYQRELGKKHIRFKSLTELLYLHKNYYKPDPETLKLLGLSHKEKYVFLRFVAWKALHDSGHKGLDLDTKIKLVEIIEKKGYRIFISHEAEKIEPILQKYAIRIAPESIHDVLYFAELVVSEGGTMASEAAILGTTVVYVNSLPVMGYLKEEQNVSLLYPFCSSTGVIEKVKELLSVNDLKELSMIRKNKLLEGKIDVTAFLVWFVEQFPESIKMVKEDPGYQLKFRARL
jgi:predicted glycosyltransferase